MAERQNDSMTVWQNSRAAIKSPLLFYLLFLFIGPDILEIVGGEASESDIGKKS